MKKRGPWLVKKSTIKYKNPWITVREDQLVHEDGRRGLYGVVRKADGAHVLPLDEKGYVYLVRDFQYGTGRNEIQIPGGAMDPSERPLVAVRRELREETGITARTWTRLGIVHSFTDIMDSAGNIFLAEGLRFGMTARDDGETSMRVIKVKLNQALQMVLESKITHAQSCVAILKAYYYLASRKKKGRGL